MYDGAVKCRQVHQDSQLQLDGFFSQFSCVRSGVMCLYLDVEYTICAEELIGA